MPLIIDCYNVLHETMPPTLAGLDTAGLCHALARTPWAADTITLVCDGHPGVLGLTESPVAAVELIYSGPGRTADAVIIKLIEADTAPRRLVVVSSDREIRRAARRRRAASWSSELFLHRLAKAMGERSAPAVDKPLPPPLPASEVDRWLEQFGLDAEQDDLPPPPRTHRRPEKKGKPPASPRKQSGDDARDEQGGGPGDADEDDDSRYWPPW